MAHIPNCFRDRLLRPIPPSRKVLQYSPVHSPKEPHTNDIAGGGSGRGSCRECDIGGKKRRKATDIAERCATGSEYADRETSAAAAAAARRKSSSSSSFRLRSSNNQHRRLRAFPQSRTREQRRSIYLEPSTANHSAHTRREVIERGGRRKQPPQEEANDPKYRQGITKSYLSTSSALSSMSSYRKT